jgi:hypothetical protein
MLHTGTLMFQLLIWNCYVDTCRVYFCSWVMSGCVLNRLVTRGSWSRLVLLYFVASLSELSTYLISVVNRNKVILVWKKKTMATLHEKPKVFTSYSQ